MIFGIGTDIVEVARIRENLNKYGEKFSRRILTSQEHAEFSQTRHQENFLAKRFAAKEAASKAMGTGFSAGIYWKQIEVLHDKNGQPLLNYYGEADRKRLSLGIGTSYLSISDEREYAIAFVTLMKIN